MYEYMPRIYYVVQQYNSGHIGYQRYSVVEPHGAKQKQRNRTAQKKRDHPGGPTIQKCSWSESYLFNHSVSYMIDVRLIGIYTYE